MKKIFLIVLGMGFVTTMSFSQVTDLEADVKKESTDTLDGWKKGGYFALNGSQVSLTNLVAGGTKLDFNQQFIWLVCKFEKGLHDMGKFA